MKILTGNQGTDANTELQAAVDATRPQVSALVSQVTAMTVTDQPSNESAGQMLLQIQQGIKKVDQKFDPIISPLKEAMDNAKRLKKEITDPLEEAKGIVKEKMRVWLLGERQKEAAEERRREEEKRKAELEWMKKEAARVAALPKQRIVSTSLNTSLCPSPAPTPIFTSSDPLPVKRVAAAVGTGARVTRKVTITDLELLIKSVASGEVPNDILVIDLMAIKKFDAEMPEWVKEWPGVLVEDDISIVSGTGGGGRGRGNG